MMLTTIRNTVFTAALVLPLSMIHAQSDGEFSNGADGSRGNENSEYVSGVRLGQPTYGGSGCRRGSVGVALSPGGKALSLLFDDYILEAGGGAARDVRKNCEVSVPFVVPSGYQASITRLDYRGYNFIPSGGKSHLKASYRIVDGQGRSIRGVSRRNKVFKGPLDSDYFISSKIKSNPIWSNCGESFKLNISNEMDARTNNQGDELFSTVDSMDANVNSEVRYHITWKKCDSRARPGRPDREERGGRDDRPGRGNGRG